MKLYLNGLEADLVESVLKEALLLRPNESGNIGKLLERMENCKTLQKPHNTHLTRLDGNQPKP